VELEPLGLQQILIRQSRLILSDERGRHGSTWSGRECRSRLCLVRRARPGPSEADVESGVDTVRYPEVMPIGQDAAELLSKRTRTNLHNGRPPWLQRARCHLDEALFDAYGWDSSMSDDSMLEALLALDRERQDAEIPPGRRRFDRGLFRRGRTLMYAI
jgi:hypothetical protein